MKQLNSIIMNNFIIFHVLGSLTLVFNILFIKIPLETISSFTFL